MGMRSGVVVLVLWGYGEMRGRVGWSGGEG